MSSAALLQIKNLKYRIGKRLLLDQLDMQIEPGQFVALAGENGAGKSTLIKIILDLIRNREQGQITINGLDNRQVRVREVLCYLPEKFDVKKEISGLQYLEFVAAINRQRWNQERVAYLCEQLDLDHDRLTDNTGEYSKGMKQKLGLISCFMQEKSLMILDEPLSGLDPKARYLFKQLLTQERQAGRTLFYSTHMLADAEEICDRFGILHQGRIVFEGSPAECLQNYAAQNLEQAYMACISSGYSVQGR
jgi:ABC-2 type transport system ATP-binding protein